VEPQYIKDEILPPFFKHFWNQRMALDRRNYRQVAMTEIKRFLGGVCVQFKPAEVDWTTASKCSCCFK
jgi:hypothetical protein